MNPRSLVVLAGIAVLGLAAAAPPHAAAPGPSRRPEQGCAWEKLADAALGLEAWVQRCDFGPRKIDFLFAQGALAVRYTDGGAPMTVTTDALVDVLDLQPGETAEAGMRRIFAARTDKSLAARCVLAPYDGAPPPRGVRRYAFVPDAAYSKELKAKNDPNEIGDPPCGDWGDVVDAIQYFEAQPSSGARKVLFVRLGQDTPLFDEQTLRLLPPR